MREKYISFAQYVYFFEGSVFTFQFLNDKIRNYVKKTLPSKNIQTEQN